MIKSISILLISLGSFLEIFYYVFRFTSGDGDNIYIAVIKGIALTVLLSVITIIMKKHKYFIIPFIILMAYSVICTSAGQSMQYNEMDISRIETDPIIMQLNQDITQLSEESKALSEIRSTVDLADKWKYSGVIDRSTDESDKITDKILEKQKQIEDRKIELMTTEKINSDIYQFYLTLFEWPVKWSQFILQTMLSLFIAIMAPIGILLIGVKDTPPTSSVVPIDKNILRDWVFYSWYLYRNKGINKMPQDSSIIELMRRKYPEYTEKTHKMIKDAAKTSGIVDKEYSIVYTVENDAIKALIKSLED